VADDWRNALADEPTTADVLDRMQPKSWLQERLDRQVPTLQDYYRGQQGGMLTPEQLAAAPARVEPNAIGRAMSYIPEDVMFAANFLGPKVPMPPRIAKPIRAYHGSPHDFDKFDLSKIGSGEGNQAYGSGLYFAQEEAVAKGYRDRLAGQAPGQDAQKRAADWLSWTKGDPVEAARIMRDEAANFHQDHPLTAQTLRDGADLLDSGKFTPPGKMYEVALHATPESFLDWDKPLGGQSQQARGALEKAYEATRAVSGYKVPLLAHVEVGEHLNSLRNAIVATSGTADPKYGIPVGSAIRSADRQSASILNEAGIPGIRYLDQGSRGMRTGPSSPANDIARQWLERVGGDQKQAMAALEDHLRGSGQTIEGNSVMAALRDMRPPTSNYVVWSPEIIEILRKYGIAGPAVVGGGVAVNGLAGDQQ
jgi:hypothetical protein